MTHSLMDLSAETVAIRDLIALYRALDRARLSLDGSVALSQRDNGNKIASVEDALIREERAELELKIDALRQEILQTPINNRANAFQKLRFQLIEFGDEPAAMEVALLDFASSLEIFQRRESIAIAERLEEIEGQLALIAFSLAFAPESVAQFGRIESLTELVKHQIGETRRDLLAPPVAKSDAA